MQSALPDSADEQLLQVLSAMLIQVNALQTVVGDETSETNIDTYAVRDGLRLLERMAREALYVVHATLDDAPPAELVGSTLAEALSRLVEETAEMLGVSSRVSFSGVDDDGRPREHALPAAAERTLYSVAREALYQVQRHSGVRRLRLVLNYGPDDVQMSIEDDGINLDLHSPPGEETGTDLAAPPFAEPLAVMSVPLVTDLRNRVAQYGGTRPQAMRLCASSLSMVNQSCAPGCTGYWSRTRACRSWARRRTACRR